MYWLFNSSIGRKLVMSISGIVLVLFLFFHLAMNITAVFSEDAYNAICSLLGANWYAVAATVILGGIIAIHFIYAFVLTLQNQKARGINKYAVNDRPKNVSWASQNMFVLGITVIGFLFLHFAQFWYKMMFTELLGHHEISLGGEIISPQDGASFIKYYFSQTWIVIAYLIWYVALWFHLSHGFWSALQSVGFNNKVWYNRWKITGQIIATILCLGFALVTIHFYVRSFCSCPF